MSITYNVLATGAQLTDEAGDSRSVNVTVASGQSRLVVLVARLGFGSTPVTIKVDGVTLTPHQSGDNTDSLWAGAASQVNPTTGVRTVRFESGGGSPTVVYAIVEVAGDSSTLAASVFHNGDYTTSFSKTISTTATTDLVFSIAGCQADGVAASSPQTQLFAGGPSGNSAAIGVRAGQATTTTIAYTASGANRWSMPVIALAEGAAPSGPGFRSYYAHG